MSDIYLFRFCVLLLGFSTILNNCGKKAPVDDAQRKFYEDVINQAQRVVLSKDRQKVLHYYDSLFSQPIHRNPVGIYFYYVANREYYRLSTDPKDYYVALAYSDSCIAAFDNVNLPIQYQVVNYMNKGIVLIKLQRYDEGIQYLFKGKQLAKTNLSQCVSADFDEEIAYLFFSQQRYTEAKDTYVAVLSNRVDCFNDPSVEFYNKARTINNVGFTYEKLNEPDSALAWYQKALDYILANRSNSDINQETILEWEGVVLGNMGYLLFQRGEKEKGERYVRESIAINKHADKDYNDALLTEIKLAEVLIERNALDEAQTLITNLKQEPYITNTISFLVRLKRVEWLYYEQKNDIKKAYSAYVSWQSTLNEYNRNDFRWRTINLPSEIQGREYQVSLSELKAENTVKTVFLFFIVLIAVLVLIIAWLIHRNSKNLTSYVKNLESTNNKLNRSYADLEVTLDENSRLMGVLAHDLRSPLAAINGYTQLYEADSDEQNRTVYIKTIHDITENAMQLIDELLSLQESKKTSPFSEESLDRIIDYCISLHQFKAKEKKVGISYTSSGLTARVQKEQFWRVISNLIHNAIKFSPEFSTIYIRTNQTDSKTVIKIQDEGLGIPESYLNDLFSFNPKVRRKGTKGENSFGMGLAICKSIMDNHNGTITVNSIEQKGSTFIIELPRLESKDATE